MTRFYKKIMDSGLGKAFKVLNIWKNLPEKRDEEKLKKLNLF